MTATTRRFDPTALENMLCLSFELGEGSWTLSFTSGHGAASARPGLGSPGQRVEGKHPCQCVVPCCGRRPNNKDMPPRRTE